MKRRLYLPLLLILLVSWISGVLPFGQPEVVYAAPGTVTIRPNAVGDEALCTIGGTTPAATNWESVDEVTSDVDVTYVEDGGSGYMFDLYNLEDTALSGTINSVTVYVNVRGAEKEGTGAQTRIKTNSVAYVGAEIAVTTSYVANSTVYDTNPQTGAAWTWDEVNALQAGVGLQKPTGGALTRCTQVWVDVDYTPPPDISNTPNSWAFGTVEPNMSYETGLSYVENETGFRITNSTEYAVKITISAGTMAGGTSDWLLADDGTPTETKYALWAGTPALGDYTIAVTSTGVELVASIDPLGGTQDWGLKLMTPKPASFPDSAQRSGTVILTATAA